jgi:FKBP-type peptidyl-prolyl cis-trans isomerase SlyD
VPIQEGDFIRLSYTGSFGGIVFDTTDEETAKSSNIHSKTAIYGPVVIRVGSHHVILGLDEALIGREVGDEGDVTVPPEKGFGEHEKEKVMSFPKGNFKEKPVRGRQVTVDKYGEGTVIDIIGSRVIVDFNPPLAGKTLEYHFRIEELVESPEEKVKGLIRLYAGRDMDLVLDDGVVKISLPAGITFDRRWMIWRSRVIHESFEFVNGVNEIVFIETFKRPEKVE